MFKEKQTNDLFYITLVQWETRGFGSHNRLASRSGLAPTMSFWISSALDCIFIGGFGFENSVDQSG